MVVTESTEFCSVVAAAKLLGVSPSTIWRWIEAGKLPAYRVGPKRIRIRRADLAATVRPVRSTREERLPVVNEVATRERLTEEEAIRGLEALKALDALRARILARRGGEPMPESWEDIRQAREERAKQLL